MCVQGKPHANYLSLTCTLMIQACLMISNAAWEAAPARTQIAEANITMPGEVCVYV